MSQVNFTDHARTVLNIAREESVNLSHEYIGTEHMLLALLHDDSGVGSAVIRNLNVSPQLLASAILGIVRRGSSTPATTELPFTTRAKKVIELAMAEASFLGHSYVGTEHLLLGLLTEEKGIAAQVMVESGITKNTARAEVLRLLGEGSGTPEVEGVTVVIKFRDGTSHLQDCVSADAAIRFLRKGVRN